MSLWVCALYRPTPRTLFEHLKALTNQPGGILNVLNTLLDRLPLPHLRLAQALRRQGHALLWPRNRTLRGYPQY